MKNYSPLLNDADDDDADDDDDDHDDGDADVDDGEDYFVKDSEFFWVKKSRTECRNFMLSVIDPSSFLSSRPRQRQTR